MPKDLDDYIKEFADKIRELKRQDERDAPAPDSVGTEEVMASRVDQGRRVTVNIGDVGKYRVSMTSDGKMRCQCGEALDIALYLDDNSTVIIGTCEHIKGVLATGRLFVESDEMGSSYPVFVFSRGNGRVVAKPADGATNPAVEALAAIISQLAMYGTNSRAATENAKKIIAKLKAKGYMIILTEGSEADLVQEEKQRQAEVERKKRVMEKAAAERERERIAAESATKSRWIQLDD